MSIFKKLFLLLALISALPLALTCVVLLRSTGELQSRLLAKNHETAERGSRTSQQVLSEQARAGYLQIVRDKSARLEAFFSDIRRALALESELAAQQLRTPVSGAAPPLYPANEVARRVQEDGEFLRAEYGRKPYSIYHLAPGTPPAEVAPLLERLRPLGLFFAHTYRDLPGCMTVYLGHKDGFIFGYPGKAAFKPEYDPRQRSWYRAAARAGRLVWTDLYVDKNGRDMVITAAQPLDDGAGGLLGVAAVDVRLTDILERLLELRDLQVADAILMDSAGQVRVSARYRRDRSARLSAGSVLEPESAARYNGGLYAPVLRAIKEAPERPAGVVALATGADELPTGVILAYSAVDLGDGTRWYYAVSVPVAGIVAPVRQVRRALLASQGELSAEIHSRLRALWLLVLALSAGVVVLACLAAFLSARSVSGPLIRMSRVASRIGQGDLEQRVEVGSSDEVGQMGLAINEMIKGLKERDFVKSTFKRYVAASVVEKLLRDPESVKLGGERKELTVFFSDLAGFTSLSETLSPEELVGLINEYLGAMTDAIFAEEGTIDKYEGDAIMAFWGAPVDQDAHALRACRAALANLDALRRLWPVWEARGLPRIDLRIGINTGPMVVGNMGSPAKMDYTVMGDSVNLGSRLEGANKTYGTNILISEATRRAAGEAVEVREVDRIGVQGRQAAVRVFELVGLKGQVPARRLEGYRVFETGLAAYRQRRWEEAAQAFTRARVILDDDPVAQIFQERLADLRSQALPDDWDGTYRLTAK